MKYAVIAVVNGAFTVKTEHETLNTAIVSFHSVCTNLWNSADVQKATVAVLDEKMQFQKIELIHYNEQA